MNNSDLTIPSSPLALYVKIYCKKKEENTSRTNNVIEEATKSWLTLSSYEKQQFTSKYHQLKRNINKEFADQLKNAIPYLKKKVTVSRPEILTNSQELETGTGNESAIEENNVYENVDHSADITDVPNIEENTPQVTSPERTNNDTILESEIQNQCNEEVNETYKTPLPEPIPPKLLNGQQLFVLVNEGADYEAWRNLSSIEKRQYQNAVLAIKRNYLKDYRKYLENLPSEKLHKLYKNNIQSL